MVGLDDVVVELEITPDRGYALSVRGVARELSHAFDVPLRDPALAPAPSGTDHAAAVAEGPRGSSPAQITSSTAAGTRRAVSLSQYWKAWTKVMLRMPPDPTLTSTTSPTTTGPTQRGASMAAARVSPAPSNCGSR